MLWQQASRHWQRNCQAKAPRGCFWWMRAEGLHPASVKQETWVGVRLRRPMISRAHCHSFTTNHYNWPHLRDVCQVNCRCLWAGSVASWSPIQHHDCNSARTRKAAYELVNTCATFQTGAFTVENEYQAAKASLLPFSSLGFQVSNHLFGAADCSHLPWRHVASRHIWGTQLEAIDNLKLLTASCLHHNKIVTR